MKHYFLFGEMAVKLFEQDGLKALLKQAKKGNYDYEFTLFVFTDGETTPEDLLYAYNGFGNYICLEESDYKKLLKYSN